MKHIIEVYDKFKHLDVLLSDKVWMTSDDNASDKIRNCCHELWMAIKSGISDMPRDHVAEKLICLCDACRSHWAVKTGEGKEYNMCMINRNFDMDNNDIVVACKNYL